MSSDMREPILLGIVDGILASAALIDRIGAADVAALGAEGLSPFKIVSEAALLLLVARPAIARSGRNDAARAFLIQASSRREIADAARAIERYPQTAGALGILTLACHDYGCPLPFDPALRAAIASPMFLAAERLPFRMQEALWLRERLCGIAADWSGSAGDSLLARAPHAAILTRDDLYALTHSAMYLGDFGARGVGVGEAVILSLRHGIAMALCSADWDMAGEMAMACRHLRVEPPEATLAETMLVSVYRRHGIVPGLGLDPERWATMMESEAELYRFAHGYHSTLVLGLLLAAPPGRPQAAPAIDPIDEEAACMAIANVAGGTALSRGCLDPGWFADEIAIGWDVLLDGHAARVLRGSGLADARRLLAAVPGVAARPLLADTQAMLARTGRYLAATATTPYGGP